MADVASGREEGVDKADRGHGVEGPGRWEGVQSWLGQWGGASQDMLSTRMMLV